MHIHKKDLIEPENSWLQITMSDDSLGVLAMQGFSLSLNMDSTCKDFMPKYDRKMCSVNILNDQN